jgi:predicted TIM-barrel fold metal-dependent hydrolase
VGFIDADGHLVEADETWSYLEPDEEQYRPKLIDIPAGTHGLKRPTQAWLYADSWCSYLGSRSDNAGVGNSFDPGATHLRDPSMRVQDLDALGVDVQLVISSFFIGAEFENPIAEAAVCRSYNRWVAECLDGYTDRLAWSLVAPFRSPERALEELEFGAAHGARAVHIRGLTYGFLPSDPMFLPVWERAQDLNLAIVVHNGAPNRRIDGQEIGRGIARRPFYWRHIYELMIGFADVLSSDLHTRFPRLRWGFLEGGSTWVLGVLQQHARLAASGRPSLLDIERVTPEELEEKNIFISCEADEDLPYLIGAVGENVLCAGTDYGHNDIGSELAVHATILQRTDVSRAALEKVVDANGRKLLGLPAQRPALAPDVAIPDLLPHVTGLHTDDGRPVLSSLGA